MAIESNSAPSDVAEHLGNVADNLQLIADMSYGDTALAVPSTDGGLRITADARPNTAVAAVASPRVGRSLSRQQEVEAFRALDEARPVIGERRRTTRGISYSTSADPVLGPGGSVLAIVIRDTTERVTEAPGAMERSFMRLADELVSELCVGPLLEVGTGRPFSTSRRAGDGVMQVDEQGAVAYASPNAVNIMRSAGAAGAVTGTPIAGLPGGEQAVLAVLSEGGALATEVAAGERVLSFRVVALPSGALVLVEDVTDARRREQEIRVKEATIREVHHRVKNNLQTIASLLRIQARRTDSDEARHALHEAVERISSMAVVHEMLTASSDERVDFADVARIVVDMVRKSLVEPESGLGVSVEGTTGDVPAAMATSLSLVTAELVHNAFEHGLARAATGHVTVTLRRLADEIQLIVRDDGGGMPTGFDVTSSANLGLTIVSTVVEQDLRGTLTITGARGTTVTVRVPIPVDEKEG